MAHQHPQASRPTYGSMNPDAPQRRFAVLVDADSMGSPALLKQMLDTVREEGRPTIRRAYGDWTEQKLAPWKAVLHEYAFQPIQQFRYVNQGNSTDSALIIDAMDILHGGLVEGFCLIASDSDYTRLATRLQESDKFVLGIGGRDANPALQRACHRYVPTDLLVPDSSEKKKGAQSEGNGKVRQLPEAARDLLVKAFDLSAGPDGVAALATMGNKLLELDSTFDCRNYNKKRLIDLVLALPKDFAAERLGDSGHVRITRAQPPVKSAGKST